MKLNHAAGNLRRDTSLEGSALFQPPEFTVISISNTAFALLGNRIAKALHLW
jgi:hypothetical protein